MGHITLKDEYKKLGQKINNLPTRSPVNEKLYAILKELYTPKEARIVASMPYGLETIENISKNIKISVPELTKYFDSLTSKGLVMDLWINEKYYYMPSPMVIGIFEFTMMRTRGELDYKTWAKLFYQYLHGEGEFHGANFNKGEIISLIRSLPHEETILDADHTEILDYEKARHIIDSSDKFAKGLCSCRHEKMHINKKECNVPLDTCSTFGYAADYWIRNNLAEEVSKSEMHENLERSRELGLVLCVDNVKRKPTFLCHCCKCCCHALAGINTFGYTNSVVSSNYIATVNIQECNGCSICEKKCPANAIKMVSLVDEEKKKIPEIDEEFCLGCGVCSLKCKKEAIKLKSREKRILHPDTTFHRVILGCLERGTLQNQIFIDPGSITQKFMRGFLGGFFRLSLVKKALLSDLLRSRFLTLMEKGASKMGQGHLVDM